MNTATLKSLHKRAAIAASLLVAGLVAFILVYMTAVEKGALPSVTQSLVQKSPPLVASNRPPEKVETVAAPPPPPRIAPTPPPSTKQPTPTQPNKMASSTASPTAAVVEAASVAPPSNTPARPAKEPSVTNMVVAAPTSTTKPALSNTTTNITAEDKRLARAWLENTNQRPSIRVQYFAPDILRLATELKRGLLVAGNGLTSRSEVFLQAASGQAVRFSPFTRSVAKHFADYSIALNPSPTFPTAALAACFPDDDHHLTFVPDRPLAELIFAHVARAARTVQMPQVRTNSVVFEGSLTLAELEPVFEIVAVRCGGKQLALAAEPSATATLPRADATTTPQAAQ